MNGNWKPTACLRQRSKSASFSFPYPDWMAIKEATEWYSFIISEVCWLLMSVHWLVGLVSSLHQHEWVWSFLVPVAFITSITPTFLMRGQMDCCFIHMKKGPVMKQIEDLIKIPLLLQPVWFIIEEKIWVKCYEDFMALPQQSSYTQVRWMLWRFYL